MWVIVGLLLDLLDFWDLPRNHILKCNMGTLWPYLAVGLGLGLLSGWFELGLSIRLECRLHVSLYVDRVHAYMGTRLRPWSVSNSFLCGLWAWFLMSGIGFQPCLNNYSGLSSSRPSFPWITIVAQWELSICEAHSTHFKQHALNYLSISWLMSKQFKAQNTLETLKIIFCWNKL